MEKPTLENIINFAIAIEEAGYDFYSEMAKVFANNPELLELFNGLAADESVHKNQFSTLMKELPDVEWDQLEEEKQQLIQAMAISEFFDMTEGPFKNISKVKNRDDALLMAFNFEKATLAYYEAVALAVGHHHKSLNALIQTEKDHVFKVMKLLLTGAKFRSMQDKWLK